MSTQTSAWIAELVDEVELEGVALPAPVLESDGPEPISRASGDKHFDPHVVWQMVLSELALQMPAATYDTWVRDTFIMGYEDGEFIVGMPNAYARDWLENRLRHTIKRTLSSIVRRSVDLQFRVCARPVVDTQVEAAPLYRATEPVQGGQAARMAAGSCASNRPTNSANTLQQPVADSLSAYQSIMDAPVAGKLASNTPVSGKPASNTEESRPRLTGLLNPQHTFDSFIVGNHNRLAHAAALAVVDAPGQIFNPLFIYGGVGLGKTHLLNAIGNSLMQRGLHMIYCSSEQFTNELISAIRNQSTDQFRARYRQVDVLLLDDIQFIGGKESTQEEFFHTFNHLHAAGKQIVLSSDRPPKALATLEERLRSRFEGGLLTDISQPDFETRVAILQSKANRIGAPIPYDVLMLVAERVDSNIRELEGALNRLSLQARLSHTTLTLAFARSVLDDLAPERVPCAPVQVVRIVAEYFHLRSDDLTGRKRTKEVANARQIAMYLLREENDLSLPAIGEYLGGRDHSTIRYGVERVEQDLAHDEALRQAVITLRDRMYVPVM